MRISRDLAEKIAIKLLEPKKEKLNKEFLEFKDKISDYINSLAPKEIEELNKKYPEYFFKTTNVRIEFSYNNIYLNKPVFEPLRNKLKEEHYNQYSKFFQLKKDLENLRIKTQESILACRTTKNLEVVFPETIPFIPKQVVSSLPAINFSDLFKEIQNFPKEKIVETKEEKIKKVKEANEIEIKKRNV